MNCRRYFYLRKKIELAVLLLFLAVLVLLSKNLQKKLVSSGNITAKNKIIVLDSGHGGDDPGKIGVNQAKKRMSILRSPEKLKKTGEKKAGKL